jgi:hypothetical protein
MDIITNETIRTKIRMKKGILQEIEEEKLRWYGHVVRMEDSRIARQVAELKPQGNRRRGEPVNTWKGGFKDSLQRGNFKDEECFDRQLLGGGDCL